MDLRDSKTAYQSEQFTEMGCDMNKKLSSVYPNEEVYSSQCPSCPGKPDNICEWCMDNCHRHPNFKGEVLSSKLRVKLSSFECECAKNDHIVQEPKSTISKRTSSWGYSQFNVAKNFLKKIGLVRSQERIMDYLESKPLIDHVFTIINSFDELIEDRLCFNRIPYYVFKSPYFSAFFPSVEETIKNLEKQCDPNNYDPRRAKRSVPLHYETEIKKLMEILDIYKAKSLYLDNNTIKNLFNFDFMKKLFSVQKFHERDDLLETKYQALRAFIDLHIKPKTNQKFRRAFTNSLMNTSPVHRIAFRQKLTDFFRNIGISRDDYLGLLNSIYNYLVNVYQFEKPSPEEEVANPQAYRTFFQYLRLIKILFTYDLTDEIELVETYIKQILSINLISTKKLNNLANLQVLIPIVINDIVCGGNKLNDKNYSFFFESTPTHLKFVKQFFSAFKANTTQVVGDHFDGRENVGDLNRRAGNKLHGGASSHYARNTYIYDMLLSKHDVYSESLVSLLAASNNYIDRDLLSISPEVGTEGVQVVHEGQGVQPSNNHQFNPNEEYFESSTFVNDFEEIKKNIFTAQGQEKADPTLTRNYITIDRHLEKIKEDLNNSLNLCNQTNKNFKQIHLTKMNLMSHLIEIYTFFTIPGGNNTKSRHMYDRILELISKLVEDNSFLCSFLFNEKMLRLFPLESCPDKYIMWLNTLKKDKYKINLSQFIKFNESYFLQNLDSPPGELQQKLEIYHSMLKISSKKSIEVVNNHIWSHYHHMPELFLDKYTYYLNNVKNRTEEQTAFALSNVIRINKIILNMSPNYLHMLKLVLPLEIISSILKLDVEIPPEHRISFIKLYDKCYIKYPYKVYSKFNPARLKLVEKQETDNKVRIRFNNNFSEPQVKTKKSHSVNAPTAEKQKEEVNLDIFGEKKEEEVVTNLAGDKTKDNSVERIEDLIDEMDPIIYNISQFKTIYDQSEKDSFNKNPRFLLKYFVNVILIPAMDYLYKVTYFSQNINYTVKYKIYQVVHIFIKAYKYLLDIIEKSKYIKEEYLKLFTDFFVTDEKDKKPDISLLILRVVSLLDKAVKDFDRETVDHVNHDEMLSIFNYYAAKMNINFSISRRVDKGKGSTPFQAQMAKFMIDYELRKVDYDKSVIHTLVNTNQNLEDDYDIATIKVNLLALIFNYSGFNEEVSKINEIVDPYSNYCLGLANKLIDIDPSFYQLQLSNATFFKKEGIYSLIDHKLLFFYQFVFIEFWNRVPSPNNKFICYFNRIIKLVTLMCKNMNTFYIRVLSGHIVHQQSGLNLTSFTLKILSYILEAMDFQSKKTGVLSEVQYFNTASKAYIFTPVFRTIFGLYKEFLHCEAEGIFQAEDESSEFTKMVEETNRMLHTKTCNKMYTSLFIEYLDFIHNYCYQHEYDFPIQLKDMLTILNNLYKELYMEVVNDKKPLPYYNSHVKLLDMITKNEDILQNPYYLMLSKLYIIINYNSSTLR